MLNWTSEAERRWPHQPDPALEAISRQLREAFIEGATCATRGPQPAKKPPRFDTAEIGDYQ